MKTCTLNVWDIDDTLGKTKARVAIIKNDQVVKVLEPSEYNTYKLKSDEKFDYSQFRCGKLFRDTFVPIENVLNKAKSIVMNQDETSKSIIITARADFKHHKEFLQTFRDYGFPIDQVYVERAGNISELNPNFPAHINKGVIIKKYLKTGKWNRICMWDDHAKNLDILFKIAELYSNIEAVGYLVKDGKISRYKPKRRKKMTNSKWNRDVANQIWLKLKGKSVPDSYSDKECEDILRKYWHKAMESEQ